MTSRTNIILQKYISETNDETLMSYAIGLKTPVYLFHFRLFKNGKLVLKKECP